MGFKISLLYGIWQPGRLKSQGGHMPSSQKQNDNQNHLALYRRRMRFSQKLVARLLGHQNTSMLSRYEHGKSTPPLLTALRLEIVYRVPVAFLFPSLYEGLRHQIRQLEETLAGRGQQILF